MVTLCLCAKLLFYIDCVLQQAFPQQSLFRCLNSGDVFVLLENIWQRPDRSDRELVDLVMTLCVVLLDLFHC
jgi:hypothetical protein